MPEILLHNNYTHNEFLRFDCKQFVTSCWWKTAHIAKDLLVFRVVGDERNFVDGMNMLDPLKQSKSIESMTNTDCTLSYQNLFSLVCTASELNMSIPVSSSDAAQASFKPYKSIESITNTITITKSLFYQNLLSLANQAWDQCFTCKAKCTKSTYQLVLYFMHYWLEKFSSDCWKSTRHITNESIIFVRQHSKYSRHNCEWWLVEIECLLSRVSSSLLKTMSDLDSWKIDIEQQTTAQCVLHGSQHCIGGWGWGGGGGGGRGQWAFMLVCQES